MTEINFSYSIGNIAAQPPTDESLWSFNNTSLFPAASLTILAQPRRNGPGTLLRQDVAQALGLCNEFRSINDHINHLISAMPALANNRQDTQGVLQSMAKNGVLESSVTAWQRLTAGHTEKSRPACGVCILTCDRPDALKRLLDGLNALPENTERIWVIDDSRNAGHLAENAKIVAHFSKQSPVKISHCDNALRDNLISYLESVLPDATTSIRWLLSRNSWGNQPTYGQARTLALLLSVGQHVLMLDDDVIPEAICPPVTASQLRFRSGRDRAAIVWASKADMTAQEAPLEKPPLVDLMSPVGAPLGTLLKTHALSHRSLANVDGALTMRYHANSAILISQCGYWGDAGTGNSGSWLAYQRADTLQNLLESHTDLEAALGARASWSGFKGAALTPYGTMSAATGVDHSVLLPPYFPVQRGEDIMFGIMVQRMHPDSVAFNTNWAIRHEPIEKRDNHIPLSPMSAQPDLGLLADWLGREPADQWGLPAERRLADMSDQVWRLAEMNQDSLESLVREHLASKRASLLQICMEHMGQLENIEKLKGTAQWRGFLERSRDNLLAEIQDPDRTPLSTIANLRDPEGMENLRVQGAAFAKALEDWPSICEAMKSFKV